jgi:hypothetical protein
MGGEMTCIGVVREASVVVSCDDEVVDSVVVSTKEVDDSTMLVVSVLVVGARVEVVVDVVNSCVVEV